MMMLAWGKSTIMIPTIPIEVDQLEPDEWHHIVTKTIRAIDQLSYIATAEKIDLVMYQFEFPMAMPEAENTSAVFDDLASVFFAMPNQCIRGMDGTVIGDITANAQRLMVWFELDLNINQAAGPDPCPDCDVNETDITVAFRLPKASGS